MTEVPTSSTHHCTRWCGQTPTAMAELRRENNSNVQNSKRTYLSLDHLTNFSLPPRPQPVPAAPRRSKRQVHNPWHKEKFVNANYRFVMKPTGDYTVHFADPDIFFQWQDILQVIIPPQAFTPSDDSNTNCPICLSSPPIAPRVTKCGHIFCFPCILRYLQLGQNPKWNRCPICFDSVNESHLKCVKWDTEDSSLNPSNSLDGRVSLTMRLIERPQITTLALPRSSSWPSDLIPPHQAPFYFLPDVSTFAKFMLATPTYILSNLSSELDQLAVERESLLSLSTQDDVGLNFITAAEEKVKSQMEKAIGLESTALNADIEKAEKAVRGLNKKEDRVRRKEGRKEKLRAEDAPLVTTSLPEEKDDVDEESLPIALLQIQSAVSFDYSEVAPPSSSFASSSSSSPPILTNIPQRAQKSRRNVNPPPHSTSTYFFYQAANGAPIFLDPLDIRILLAHFGSYTNFPDSITLALTPSSSSAPNDYEPQRPSLPTTTETISPMLLKRSKYLSHLPTGTYITFIEAGHDLESVVGKEGLKSFEGVLKSRTAKRRERERKDERMRLRAEEKEREKGMQNYIQSSAPPDDRWHGRGNWHDAEHSQDVELDHGEQGITESETRQTATTSRASPNPVATPASTPATRGAWGARSFAQTTASSSPTPNSSGNRPVDPRVQYEDDEWQLEIDAAWKELERKEGGSLTGGGGKRGGGSGGGGVTGKKGGGKGNKGGKKLVLLTGGGRGRY